MSNVNSRFFFVNAIMLISSACALKEAGYGAGMANVIAEHNHNHRKSVKILQHSILDSILESTRMERRKSRAKFNLSQRLQQIL